MSQTNSLGASRSVGPIEDLTPMQHSFIEENISKREISLESFRSIMTTTDLDVLRDSCFVSDEFHMVLARPQKRVHNPPTGGLGIYEEALRANLHFFLHPFVVKLLSRYALSSAQLVPNS